MDQKRILIIDDEPSMTRMIRLTLEMTKRYQVREENQAMRALISAREFEPDLILLDVIMPGVDGGELARRIKADPSLSQVPVIFLTGTVTKKEAEEGAVTAGYPLLSKPVSLKSLVECMENTFAAKAHEVAKPSAKP
ncbi:MAG: response regulator [Verrucomicrobia bacterium]|nr:response regulator [Verrucomicrobiota bacterium]